jgi:hypothetical protein
LHLLHVRFGEALKVDMPMFSRFERQPTTHLAESCAVFE